MINLAVIDTISFAVGFTLITVAESTPLTVVGTDEINGCAGIRIPGKRARLATLARQVQLGCSRENGWVERQCTR
jgi:hypothetical protein